LYLSVNRDVDSSGALVGRALSRQRKAPIQLFSYADDDVCVARGRSGGLAVWARATAEWELANGVV